MKFPNRFKIVLSPIGPREKKLIFTWEFISNRGDPKKRGDVFVCVRIGDKKYPVWGAKNVRRVSKEDVEKGLEEILTKHRRELGAVGFTYVNALLVYVYFLDQNDTPRPRARVR